jgi:hypothetical protein
MDENESELLQLLDEGRTIIAYNAFSSYASKQYIADAFDLTAKLALHLYRETASLLYPVLSEQRRLVIEEVLHDD